MSSATLKSPAAPVVRVWQPSPFGMRSSAARAAEDAEEARRRAQQEGFEEGRRAGLAAAQDVQRQLQSVLESAERALALLEERLAGELLDFAVVLARQVVRREIQASPDAVLAAAREALGVLAQEARAVQVLAHPEDVALLRSDLGHGAPGLSLALVEDPRIERGGVRVVSSAGEIDATLGARWRRVLSSLGQDHPWGEPETG